MENCKPEKPVKPVGCPLFPHATKRWAKKINGSIHYFGPWNDLPGALAKLASQYENLKLGRKPRPEAVVGGLRIKELCNRFLTSKKILADNGEITQRMFGQYDRLCRLIAKLLGASRAVEDLGPEDFERLRAHLQKTLGPVSLGVDITRIKTIFKYAADNLLISRLVGFGTSFQKPTKKVIRLARAKAGKKSFAADEIRALLQSASVQVRAMILLGINAGLGQSDINHLPLAALDLKGGWLNYPRPKTGVERRCPLWPETVEALWAAIDKRPCHKHAEDANLVFLTQHGARWCRTKFTEGEGERAPRWTEKDSISQVFRALRKRAGVSGHRGFYCLRRTFETIGGNSLDQVGVDYIMGHVAEDDDMGAVYRQEIFNDRLCNVVQTVRDWLGDLDEPARELPEGEILKLRDAALLKYEKQKARKLNASENLKQKMKTP